MLHGFYGELTKIILRVTSNTFNIYLLLFVIIIIIIIIISIFKEDNVFSITASLPYGPPVNTDIDYYQTFFRLVNFCNFCKNQYFIPNSLTRLYRCSGMT